MADKEDVFAAFGIDLSRGSREEIERLRIKFDAADANGYVTLLGRRVHRDRFAETAANLARGIEPVPQWAVEAYRNSLRRRIDMLRKEFAVSANPMFAWEAYLLAREIGDLRPDWVMQYLDGAAVDFWGAFQQYQSGKRKNDPGKAFLAAFSIREGKKPSVWTEYTDTDWIFVGSTIMLAARQFNRNNRTFDQDSLLKDAQERINQPGFTLSYGAAWRALQRYQRAFPEEAAELKRLLKIARSIRKSKRKLPRNAEVLAPMGIR
jgi:hypothetical protein